MHKAAYAGRGLEQSVHVSFEHSARRARAVFLIADARTAGLPTSAMAGLLQLRELHIRLLCTPPGAKKPARGGLRQEGPGVNRTIQGGKNYFLSAFFSSFLASFLASSFFGSSFLAGA